MTATHSITRNLEIIGGLSNPAKMPCYSWSIPAEHCIVGSKLRGVSGSTCESCYARKGTYRFDSTIKAMDRRWDILQTALASEAAGTRFVVAFSDLLNTRLERQPRKYRGPDDARYFRWHDSGDLQSVEHLDLIVRICRSTPKVSHWLPTRERVTVGLYRGRLPENLVVRLSDPKVDSTPRMASWGLPTSGVHSESDPGDSACPAPSQNGECLDCRRCWDAGESRISYHLH